MGSGYRAAAQCGDDSGEDFRVEFQILHCAKKVWNPFRAGGCIFPVLEEDNNLMDYDAVKTVGNLLWMITNDRRFFIKIR